MVTLEKLLNNELMLDEDLDIEFNNSDCIVRVFYKDVEVLTLATNMVEHDDYDMESIIADDDIEKVKTYLKFIKTSLTFLIKNNDTLDLV